MGHYFSPWFFSPRGALRAVRASLGVESGFNVAKTALSKCAKVKSRLGKKFRKSHQAEPKLRLVFKALLKNRAKLSFHLRSCLKTRI